MEQPGPESYQNGFTKVFKEVNEDGVVTEYQEEQYIIDEDGDQQLKGSDDDDSPEVIILQDDDDIKVYQAHEVLPDGREMITTTTITVDENGVGTEETVTEIVESEEIEVIEEEEVEGEEVEEEVDGEEDTVESTASEEPATNLSPKRGESEPVEEEEDDSIEEKEEVSELFSTGKSEEGELASPTRSIRRHLSYEEFAEQYTEYKPPKRYEKKQTDRAADKAAPKIRIMSGEGGVSPTAADDTITLASTPDVGQGLPNNDLYSAHGPSSDVIGSPDGRVPGEDRMSEEINAPSQPTKTQGSVIRRIDQGASIDPANIVRADDKPDMEAELPSRGTSQSLKSKFQSMGSEQTPPVDFSQPVKRERPRTGQFGYSAAPAVRTSTTNEDSHHQEPEFEGGEIENCPVVRDDVVREADRNDQVELPESGQAKNLLSRWSQIETESSKVKEYKPSGIGSKPTVTPLRPTSRVDVTDSVEHIIPEVEQGEYENTPVQRTDVVKEADIVDLEEELPTVGQAKNLMSKFREKEEEAKKMQVYQPSGAGYRAPRVRSRPSSVSSAEPHIEPQLECGEVENTPIVRPDVVRESDRLDEQELPEVGYAKNLKARFKELQQQQRPADYVEHVPSGVASKATPTPIKLGNSLTASISSMSAGDDDTDSRVEPQLEGGEYENQPIRRTDVIREEDRLDEEELPEVGLTKNLMNQFKTLESQRVPSYKPSGIGSKATPSKLHIMAGKTAYSAKGIVPEPVVNTNGTEEHTVEAGEFENTPVIRDDVVRADTNNYEREMPEQGVTRNIMSRFKSIEEGNKTTVQHRPSKIASKPTPTPLRPNSVNHVDTSDVVSEASSSDRLESEGGEYENAPEINHDVIRSTDSNKNDYIPSAGAAKDLMNKFRQLETKKGDQVEHRPSKVASSLTPTPLQLKR